MDPAATGGSISLEPFDPAPLVAPSLGGKSWNSNEKIAELFRVTPTKGVSRRSERYGFHQVKAMFSSWKNLDLDTVVFSLLFSN